MTNLIGLAAELDALAHRALKLPIGSRNPESHVFIARQELARAIHVLARRIYRIAEESRSGQSGEKASPDGKDFPARDRRGPIVPGLIMGDGTRQTTRVEVRRVRKPS